MATNYYDTCGNPNNRGDVCTERMCYEWSRWQPKVEKLETPEGRKEAENTMADIKDSWW